MDNLTHTLTGLMLSRAGLNRWCALATPILLVAANAPDCDIVSSLGGALTYLDHHRGITHALAAAPVVALGSVALVRLAGPVEWVRGVVTALIGVLSHLLLDWTNTYGIRLLLPFSEEWPRLDITNVIDLVIWAILFLAVAGPVLSRLVSSEIGAKPGRGQGAAVFALAAITCYNGGRYVLHERALNILNSYTYEGAAPRRVAAFPHFANPFQWMTLVEGDGFVSTQRINLLLPYDPAAGARHYLPEPSVALDAARGTDTFERFLRFAQHPFWRVTPADQPEGAVRVEAVDLRFGDPDAPRFVASAIIDRAGRVLEDGFTFGPFRPR
ncbi:MAG: metal-dependent hydrolase [Bryobacteraceae bacterium]|nr:metal-dependent hydrolase [Bryobacteraceae bacterium]